MSTLSSASTDAQVFAAYDDNASYSEDASVPKAKAFLTACRFLLRRMPKRAGSGNADLELNPDLIQEEMAQARTWLETNDTGDTSTSTAGPCVTRASLQNFR